MQSLTSLVFAAERGAGLRGSGQSFRRSGACVVSFPVARGVRWALAVSLLCRSLALAGVRFRVIRLGAGRFGSARFFRGFAVLVARGQGL